MRMFQSETRRKGQQRPKWAKTAGDHTTLSAAGNEDTGKYIGDLNLEMTENIDYGDTELRAMLEGDRRYRSDENYSDYGYQEQEFKNNELVSVDEPEVNDEYTEDEDPADDGLFGDPMDGEDE